MIIRNFAIPIGIALFGSVAGVLVNNAGLGNFWPYSLMLLGMNSNKNEDALSSTGGSVSFLMAVFIFSILFVWIAVYVLKKRDVRA